jgi:RimJ/RimL family protein N-acetyltransferase
MNKYKIFRNDTILENSKMILRPMKMADTEGFWKLTQDETMWIYFTSDLSKRGELENWVKEALDLFEKDIRLPFTIIDKESNSVAGSTSLMNYSIRDKRIEIGSTWIANQFQRKGINQESKKLLINYCFEELRVERLEFKTDVLNKAARGGLLKAGLLEEGILRSHTLMTHNRRRDTIYYSMLRGEWEKQSNDL